MHTSSLDALRLLVAGTWTIAVLALAPIPWAHAGAPPPRVTELFTQPLPNIPGKEVTMLTVEYPPGGADPVHRHNANAFVYVLEGSVEMQMEGGKKVTLHPGQTFYEDPSGVHLVGRNTSDTEPAKFVVLLVKDPGTPVLIPVER